MYLHKSGFMALLSLTYKMIINFRRNTYHERKSSSGIFRRSGYHHTDPWLKETFDYEVCCCIDCGQGNELDGLEERAKLSGASKLYIENIIDEFCDDFIMPCVKAGAVYEHKYLLGTSMARPAIAKKLVEIAQKRRRYHHLPRRYRKRQ